MPSPCTARLLALSALLACTISSVSAALPSYIKVCSKSDPDVDACITNAIESLKPQLLHGIPELNVPSYEPLIIPEIHLSRGPKAAKLNINARNMSVYGPSGFIIKSLKSDLEKNSFAVELLLPRLSFSGDYDIDVFLLALPIRGKGKIVGNFTDYRSTVLMKGHLVQRDGEDYLEFDKMRIKLLVGKSQMHLGGLFNDDSILGEATNRLLNENSALFIEEIRPVLEDALATLFTDIANHITLAFTYRELFPQ